MVRGKYAVRLTPEERENLQRLVRGGKSPARMTTRARILLKTGDGWPAPQVAEALDVAKGTVYRIKRRFVEDKGLYGSAPKPTGTESWTTGVRLTWSRWPAAQRRRGMTTGPCACWLARWSSWGWRPPCPTKGCASGSKKRSQAVAEERVVHPQGERGVRGAHGGSAGPIRGTL